MPNTSLPDMSCFDPLGQHILSLLKSNAVSPATAAEIAKRIGSPRSVVRWQLERLERARQVFVNGKVPYRKGKPAPTYAAGDGDRPRAADLEELPVRQIVVACAERPRPDVSPCLLLRALFPHWKP